MDSTAPSRIFQFIGGNLCLDFCNTVGGNRRDIFREYFNTYSDLLSWSRQAGLLDDSQAAALAKHAARNPEEANRVLQRGTTLREALYRIFSEPGTTKAKAAEDLAKLNAELETVLGRLRVEFLGGTQAYALRWAMDNQSLDHPLGPVARAAAHLLTDPDALERVRQCGADDCSWLFLDLSKNHSRRWCDMRDCGNRAKVRRHRCKARGG